MRAFARSLPVSRFDTRVASAIAAVVMIFSAPLCVVAGTGSTASLDISVLEELVRPLDVPAERRVEQEETLEVASTPESTPTPEPEWLTPFRLTSALTSDVLESARVSPISDVLRIPTTRRRLTSASTHGSSTDAPDVEPATAEPVTDATSPPPPVPEAASDDLFLASRFLLVNAFDAESDYTEGIAGSGEELDHVVVTSPDLEFGLGYRLAKNVGLKTEFSLYDSDVVDGVRLQVRDETGEQDFIGLGLNIAF